MSPSSDACSQPADCVASVTTPAAVLAEHRAGLDRDRAAERVADDDEARGRRNGSRGRSRPRHVVHAAREIVRLAVADAHGADAVIGASSTPRSVVEPVRGAEQAAHPAAARHHDVARASRGPCQSSVSRPSQRVHLEVDEVGRDLDFFDRQRLEQLERGARFVGHARMQCEERHACQVVGDNRCAACSYSGCVRVDVSGVGRMWPTRTIVISVSAVRPLRSGVDGY